MIIGVSVVCKNVCTRDWIYIAAMTSLIIFMSVACHAARSVNECSEFGSVCDVIGPFWRCLYLPPETLTLTLQSRFTGSLRDPEI